MLLGDRLPARTRETVLHGLGLVTLSMGLQMTLKTGNVLIVMGSVLAGGILGEAWRIEEKLDGLGNWFEARVARGEAPTDDGRRIGQGFVTASLVFCVGPLTVLGSIQDGLMGDAQLLVIKSVLDGFAAMAFGAAMGPGVLLSVLTILVYQGGLSLLARLVGQGLIGSIGAGAPPILEMTAAGGILIMGIGFLLLGLKQVRVANFLPAIAIAPMAAWLVEAVPRWLG